MCTSKPTWHRADLWDRMEETQLLCITMSAVLKPDLSSPHPIAHTQLMAGTTQGTAGCQHRAEHCRVESWMCPVAMGARERWCCLRGAVVHCLAAAPDKCCRGPCSWKTVCQSELCLHMNVNASFRVLKMMQSSLETRLKQSHVPVQRHRGRAHSQHGAGGAARLQGAALLQKCWQSLGENSGAGGGEGQGWHQHPCAFLPWEQAAPGCGTAQRSFQSSVPAALWAKCLHISRRQALFSSAPRFILGTAGSRGAEQGTQLMSLLPPPRGRIPTIGQPGCASLRSHMTANG